MTLGGGSAKLLMHRWVTLTNGTLEYIPINNVKLSAAIFNRVHRMQYTCRHSDTGAPCAEATGNHLLRQSEVRAADAIMDHQQPAAQPLQYCMPRIANATLRYLGN